MINSSCKHDLSQTRKQTTDVCVPLPINKLVQADIKPEGDALLLNTSANSPREAILVSNSQLEGSPSSGSQAVAQLESNAVVQYQSTESVDVNSTLDWMVDELRDRVRISLMRRRRSMILHVTPAKSRQEAFATSVQAVQALVGNLQHKADLDVQQMSEMAALNQRKCVNILMKLTHAECQEELDPGDE